MKYIYILAISFIVVLFIACTETTNEPKTTLMTLEELKSTPGFEWFSPEFNDYTPEKDIIDQIENLYSPTNHKFYIFANPSCACTGTQKTFPSILKTLVESGISETNFEIYSIPTALSAQPYEHRFKLSSLPAAFTMRIKGSDTTYYSIIDTLDSVRSANPSTNEKIEHFILHSLQ